MCRHLGYVGVPVRAAGLLLEPPHGLVNQVDGPRCQLPGVTNRDGWGVAWRDGERWCSHRSTVPMSEDPEAAERLALVESAAVVAAIRRANPGLAIVESGNAPFVAGRWALSLNGFVGAFAEGARGPLVAALSPGRATALVGDTDTEVLLGLLLDRIDAGDPTGDALEATLATALAAAGDAASRLNLLLSDGSTIWATRWSNSLFHRELPGGRVVASEPWDDDAGWMEVPDGSVLEATVAGVAVAPLA